ncbi:hypothetical protein AVEN_108993-1 [Araneus ventricosus]|uniref:TLDc domain-containing protein n=1 Tax=Araneus ventricosus TaxID=182803 RepID=A0A4Y2SK23_ARAVE|nr:hypothetical protein AVEN_108993-1 [Araneus ventricosus]
MHLSGWFVTDGLSFFPSQGYSGLWIDCDLYRGTSEQCQTFTNDIAMSSRDFHIKTLEARGFVPEVDLVTAVCLLVAVCHRRIDQHPRPVLQDTPLARARARTLEDQSSLGALAFVPALHPPSAEDFETATITILAPRRRR